MTEKVPQRSERNQIVERGEFEIQRTQNSIREFDSRREIESVDVERRQNQCRKILFWMFIIVALVVAIWIVGFDSGTTVSTIDQQEKISKNQQPTKSSPQQPIKPTIPTTPTKPTQPTQPTAPIIPITPPPPKPVEPTLPNPPNPTPPSKKSHIPNQYSQPSWQVQQPAYIHEAQIKSFFPNGECRAQFFLNWKPQKSNPKISQNYKIEQVPYQYMFLAQNKDSPSPIHHYQQIMTYLKKKPAKPYVYIQSAPVYAVLVMGYSLAGVSFIVADSYPEKDLLKYNFELNQIVWNKLIFENKGQEAANMQGSDLLVTTNPNSIKENLFKRWLLIVQDQPVVSPSRELSNKIQAVPHCYPPTLKWDWRKQLDRGVYLFKQSC